MSVKMSLQERMHSTEYSRSACVAAIRGDEVPHALGHPLHRLCVVRGIRYHPGFGNELYALLPMFTRALNARRIMSNEIPAMDDVETIPYCIWHPQTASEDTYRELVKQYPQLSYQVGRACAVAGYTTLYQELEILPDVHIAEEARECGNLDIHDIIMSQIVRYDIMNDYNRCVTLEAPKPANLNGDTCVSWMLGIKQEFTDATSDFMQVGDRLVPADFTFDFQGYHNTMFDITEDKHIDEYESDAMAQRLLASRPSLRWLSEPLPRDLPTVQKDLLIIMAAYYGDIDRYSRLRRPVAVYGERQCSVRGIYHNTLFALWWSKQSDRMSTSAEIQKAINARFIMNNVLSRAPFGKGETPYLIWWPVPARPATYRHLAKIHPEMLPQIVRACIYAGYEGLFAELLPLVEPDKALLHEAEEQAKPYFREALHKEIKDRNIEPQSPTVGHSWKLQFGGSIERSNDDVHEFLDESYIRTDSGTPYNGRQCDASVVETLLCLPDTWKIPTDGPDAERHMRVINYVDWPPGMTGTTG